MDGVKRNIASITGNLLGADNSTVWWAEDVVCKDLGLKATPSIPLREVLTHVLRFIKNSYAGDRKRGKYSTGRNVADLYQEENGTNVHVIKHGRAIVFDGATLSVSETSGRNKPRYFSFGSPRFDISDQIDIAHAIVGNDPSLEPSAKERREKNWRKWFHHLTSSVSITKDSDGNSEKNADAIVGEFGIKAAVHLGAGTNDNEGAAQKEIDSTYDKIKALAKESEDAEIRELVNVNGVERIECQQSRCQQ